MKILSLKNDSPNPLQVFWESIVGGITHLLRNQPNNRFATKIPISGTISDPKAGILPAIGNILRSEFVKVFQGDIENIVNLQDAAEGKPQEERTE